MPYAVCATPHDTRGTARSYTQSRVAYLVSMTYCDVQPNVAGSGTTMEYASIEREIHVDASPEVVFEVVSSPEHLKQWWPDEAEIEPTAGATGRIVFRRAAPEEALVVPIMVVDAQPPRRFSFRWVYEAGALPGPSNSLLVTFDLEPSGEGTRVRMTETGFRERGWEAAVLEQAYQEHSEGWDYFVPRLGVYVARLVSSS
jgi:uncharacterized protein YndB with AHSA1/START domain